MTLPSPLHLFIEYFQKALAHRANPPSHLEIEKWGTMIGEVMSARWRHYHVPQHVFGMCQGVKDPIEILSILFHDIIYLQVDRRIHPRVQKHLYDFCPNESYEVFLHGPAGTKEYSVLPMIYSIFHVKPGHKMSTSTGLNELLSAVMALRTLKPYLSPWELLQIAGCIEATVPFRANLPHHNQPPVRLKETFTRLIKEYELEVSEQEINQAVIRSVNVANRDIHSFSLNDSSHFLFDTWNLILEGNPVFKNPYYSVNQYLSALEKVERFYSYLDPSSIVSKFEQTPTPEQHHRLVQAAHKNLKIGKAYLESKILGNSFLQAVAHLTGGDGPMILFLGEIRSFDSTKPSQIEEHLDYRLPEVSEDLLDPELLKLLRIGRAGPSPFDLRNSPLSAYIYSRLTPEEYAAAIKAQKMVSSGRLNSLEFLASMPSPVVQSLLRSLSELALSRSNAITELRKTLARMTSTSFAA